MSCMRWVAARRFWGKMDTTGFIYAVLAAILWGLVYTIDQKVLEKTSPLNFLLFYAVIMIIVLPPIQFFFGQQQIKTILNLGKFDIFLILLTIVLGLLASWFIFAAISKLGASTASIFEIAYPIFVVLFSYLLFQTSLNGYFYLGAGFIFIGSLIIVRFA